MAVVQIAWDGLHWNCRQIWKNDLPVFQNRGVSQEDLKWWFYALRLNGLFAIKYARGIYPSVYISKGNQICFFFTVIKTWFLLNKE